MSVGLVFSSADLCFCFLNDCFFWMWVFTVLQPLCQLFTQFPSTASAFWVIFRGLAAKSYLLDLLVLLYDRHRDRQTWTPAGVWGWWMFFFPFFLCCDEAGWWIISDHFTPDHFDSQHRECFSESNFRQGVCVAVHLYLCHLDCVCVGVRVCVCLCQSKKVYGGVITEGWAGCHWVYSSCSTLIKLCLHE